MTAKNEDRAKKKFNSALRLLEGYIYATAVIIAGAGVIMLSVALGHEQMLRQPDALLGIPNRTMLVLVGMIHLILGGYLFMARDLMIRGFTILWMGFNYLIYRGLMVWMMKVSTVFPLVQLIGRKIGITPRVVDANWKLLTFYLAMGGLLYLMLLWRRLKQLEFEAFFKELRPNS